MASVLCDPGFWFADPAIGADAAMVLHGEQAIRLHAPLPAAGSVVGRERIVDVVDRGRGGHAFVRTSREIVDRGDPPSHRDARIDDRPEEPGRVRRPEPDRSRGEILYPIAGPIAS